MWQNMQEFSCKVLEGVDVTGLVLSSEALVVALAVLCNVLLCNLAEGFANLDMVS